MSLKSGNYYKTVARIEEALYILAVSDLDVSGVVSAFKLEFQDLSAQVQEMDASMAVVETRLDGMDVSMSAVETRLDGMDASMSAVETRLDGMDVSMSAVETNKQDVITDLSSNGFLTAGSNITFDTVGSNITINSSGVGNVINAFPLSRAIFLLNEEYVVEGVGKVDWALTLSAGTYMFVFTPNAYITNSDGDAIIWTSENCNCNYIEYRLGFVGLLRFSVYPDLSVPVGNVGYYKKYFGKYTMVFTLEEETTLNLFTTFSSPEIGQPVLDPVFGYTESSIEYVKLS